MGVGENGLPSPLSVDELLRDAYLHDCAAGVRLLSLKVGTCERATPSPFAKCAKTCTTLSSDQIINY